MQYRLFDDMAQCTVAEVERLLPLVSPQRREQALRYASTLHRFTCLRSYLMLQELLHTSAPLTFTYNEYGQPSLPEQPFFSISHCPNAIAVATHEYPIGIDIERIRTTKPALIQRTMNAEEQAAIAQSACPDEAFIRFWTQKEAVAKLRGTGLITDIPTLLEHTDNIMLQTFSRPEKGYVWSVATYQDAPSNPDSL